MDRGLRSMRLPPSEGKDYLNFGMRHNPRMLMLANGGTPRELPASMLNDNLVSYKCNNNSTHNDKPVKPIISCLTINLLFFLFYFFYYVFVD